jgi:very-short-patch-repair endonuclease
MNIKLTIEASPAITYAFQHNAVPVLHRIDVANQGDVRYESIDISIASAPLFADSLKLRIEGLAPGETRTLTPIDLRLSHAYLAALNEAIRGTISVVATAGEAEHARQDIDIEVLAYDQWAGTRALPELLASFCLPNSPAVAEILRSASERLVRSGEGSLCGYQTKDRRDAMRQIGAIYAAVAERAIHYANPPANFTSGQKIRTPDRVLGEQLGTCLDLTMLLCACLEQAGLNPLVLLKDGHAWVGVWLLNASLQSPTIDDGQAIRKRVDMGEMVVLESVLLTQHALAPISAAVKRGAEHLAPEHEAEFRLAIDINRARAHRILPLPSREASLQSLAGSTVAVADLDDEVQLPPLDPSVLMPEATVETAAGRNRIDRWKTKLLDLSLRNRLLNFKPTKQTIPIYVPDPAQVEDLLADGRAFRLNSLLALLTESDPRSSELFQQRTNALPKEEVAKAAFARSELLSTLEHDELDARLVELYRTAKAAEEEGGANTLFLTIGMLEWFESAEADRKLLAPIIMVPVTIERSGMSVFKLKRHDDETVVNPTLLQKLERDFNVRIPMITGATELPSDASGVDVQKILTLCRQAVLEQKRFEVRPDVYLGLFSFTKFLMWKDLQDRTEDLLKSRLVKHLVERESEAYRDIGTVADEWQLDNLRKPCDLFVPIDADSSQLAAIHAAAEGHDFVLEGPPGTGKSQTVVNLVVDSLARNKTVLFVSEKITALQVVHDRLKQLGFGPFTLELHSAKASKNAVMEQFRQSLSAAAKRTVAEWDVEAQRLGGLRQQLNDYVDALHEVHPNGLTVFDATALVTSESQWKGIAYAWPSGYEHPREELEGMRTLARQIQAIFGLLAGVKNSGLNRIKHDAHTPVWQEQLLASTQGTLIALEKLRSATDTLQTALKLSGLTHAQQELSTLAKLTDVLLQVPGLPVPLFSESDLARAQQLLKSLAEHGRKREEHWSALGGRFKPEVAQFNGAELGLQWQTAQLAWWPKKPFALLGLRNRLRLAVIDGTRPSAAEVQAILDAITGINEQDRAISGIEAQAAALLGDAWKGLATQWNEVERIQHWLSSFSQATADLGGVDSELIAKFRQHLKSIIAINPKLFARDGAIGTALVAYKDAYQASVQKIEEVAAVAGLAASDLIDDVRSSDLTGRVSTVLRDWMTHSRNIRDWCHWLKLRTAAASRGMTPFIDRIEQGDIPGDRIADFFEFTYREWWLKQSVARSPVLAGFNALQHEQLVKDFRECDARFAELTRDYVLAKLAGNIPTAAYVAPQASPLGVLMREMNKQRGHMPVRKLMGTIGPILPRITPCVLMSPLSVAQYLDTSEAKFDLVVFDEASQIPTWDAIGAIARGRQVVVIGDPKQLPPTNFFSRADDDSGVADDTDVEDLESILNECMGAGLPQHSLKWHYRSKYESLIAFSNYRYYGSQLITFPSPTTEDKGVIYHHVPGVYQRAGARTNRGEADAVIEHIRKHYSDPLRAAKSIGVVTFSQAQQKLVMDLLDAARSKDAKLDTCIRRSKEEVFVKNLETVQGDERDIILFSICYGPDVAGNVSMNFGPLNKEGGARRLNVAVTRAREDVHIFSTLRPEQIDAARTQAAGVLDLKLYLECAVKGVKALLSHAAPTGRAPDSIFEEQVMARLTADGWIVHPQVGCSSYRIDLGVVDPRAPGRYLMAIECDGASYHSAATARDRDHLRQRVLERLGWKIHRIWSTEWWGNPEREAQRAIRALEKEMASDPAEPLPPKEELPEISLSDESVEDAYAGMQEAAKVETASLAQGLLAIFSALKPYVATTLPARIKDEFQRPTESAVLSGYVERVIESEGPISEERLAIRVLAAYAIERAGIRVRQRLREFTNVFPVTMDGEGRFYWPKDLNPREWRVYRERGDRDFDDLPIEELANFAAEALKGLGSADESSIAKLVAQPLLIQRVTQRTEARIRSACDVLVADGRAISDGGRYRVA